MPVDPDERLSLFEHLDELRKRLFWCLVVLAAGVIVAAVFSPVVFDALLHPLEQVPGMKIAVDGKEYSVAQGAEVPSGDPVFTIPSYSSSSVTFKLIDGHFADGTTTVSVNVGDTAKVRSGGTGYTLSAVEVSLPPSTYKLTTFSPAEPFMVSLKVWVVAGLILASPFLIWQLWAFVGPAFTSAQKRYFYPVVAACSLLFLGGVALAYFLVLPKGLQWLYGVGSGTFNVQNRATDYFTFAALFVLAFGAVFEMPVVLVHLARLGIIDDRFLRKNRRYAIVINAIVAAVITPSQDAFSMLAMFVPLVILYEISIVAARLVQPKRKSIADAEDPGDDSGDNVSPVSA
jgi:sec-independent protein translocase protein TatC